MENRVGGMAGSELYWVPRSTLLLLRIIIGRRRSVLSCGSGRSLHWVLRLRLGRRLFRFLSGLGDGPGPLDGLLIPGALLSLCILLCLNRINLIRSDGNLLSWLLGP